MTRINYKVDKEFSGFRVEQYLHKKRYSNQILQSLKQDLNSVLKNGHPAKMKDILSEGDELEIFRPEMKETTKITAFYTDLKIYYEDRDILVVDKPARMSTHISVGNMTGTLQNAITGYFEKRGEPFVFRCMNRLDTDTSGLTIIAKHDISAAILYQMGLRHEVKREYCCIVNGAPPQNEGTIIAPIGREEGKILKMKVDQGGKSAVTHYKVLKSNGKLSFLQVHLETGRTHQIRVHMKHLGCPIIGDYLYNPDMELIQRQALHAWKIHFLHPITGENLSFISDLPSDFKLALSMIK